MTGNGAIYGRRMGRKFGLVFSDDAVSDDTATTIAEMGQLVIDLTTGEVNYVDADTKTQVLS